MPPGKHFSFATVNGGSAPVANVFVHGYSAGNDLEDRLLLCSCLPRSDDRHINIFAFWRAGYILDFHGTPLHVAPLAAATPLSLAALAGDRVAHFLRARRRATRVGPYLLGELERYLAERHPAVRSVNLIGHSLGGRVLLGALRSLAPGPRRPSLTPRSELPVDNVLLMAAAAPLDGSDASRLGRGIRGRLINAYSEQDSILRLNPGESCAGRKIVENCCNIEMTGFGHMDYWPRLGEVLARAKLGGTLVFEADAPGGLETSIASSTREILLGVLERLSPAPENDTFLYYALENASDAVLAEIDRHLPKMANPFPGTGTDVPNLTRKIQKIGRSSAFSHFDNGNYRYPRTLQRLLHVFDLNDQFHDCVNALQVECLLLREFSKRYLPEAHILAACDGKSLREMTEAECHGIARELAAVLRPSTRSLKDLSAWIRRTADADSASTGHARWTKRSHSIVSKVRVSMSPDLCALIPIVLLIAHARVQSLCAPQTDLEGGSLPPLYQPVIA